MSAPRHLAYAGLLAAIFLAAFATVSWSTQSCEAQKARQYGDLGQYVPVEVAVKFNEGVSEPQAAAAIQSTGFAVARTESGPGGPVYFARVPEGSLLQSVCALAKADGVFYATLERKG